MRKAAAAKRDCLNRSSSSQTYPVLSRHPDLIPCPLRWAWPTLPAPNTLYPQIFYFLALGFAPKHSEFIDLLLQDKDRATSHHKENIQKVPSPWSRNGPVSPIYCKQKPWITLIKWTVSLLLAQTELNAIKLWHVMRFTSLTTGHHSASFPISLPWLTFLLKHTCWK